MGRLDRVEAGQARDLPPAQQLREADVAAEHVAAGAAGDDDGVGRPEAQVLPQLVGERLGALEEMRLPVVAGVEDRIRLPDGGVGGVLAGAGDQLDLGAGGPHLHGLGRRGRGRDQDPGAHPGRCRVGRHRGTAIAGGILQHRVDPLLAQDRQHHGRAAILEAAGGGEPFELETGVAAPPGPAHQRGAALPERDRIGHRHRQRRRVAPEGAPTRVDLSPADPRQVGDHQRTARLGAPARRLDRVGRPGGGVEIGGGHAHRGSVSGAARKENTK